MKRTTMKNAPTLPKNTGEMKSSAPGTPKFTSPVVSDLNRLMNGMTGNTITLPVCGRDVKFVLETVPAHMVKKATMVWSGNERDQALLTQASLDDLIPSFLANGQQNPAFARKTNGVIEVADGSRRRQTAIVTSSEYRVLVGELDDEQMRWLSQIGNDYRPTSAYERGKRYARRLETEFAGNVSKLSEAEGIERKVIMRCVNTAKLPLEIISLFNNPNELSARAGESLAKSYAANEDAMFAFAQSLLRRKNSGESFDTDDLLEQLHKVTGAPAKPVARERLFGTGMKARYKGDAVTFQLNNVPAELVKRIEQMLEQHQANQQKAVHEVVDESMLELDAVVTCIRTAAAGIKYDISPNELQSMIPFARTVVKQETEEPARTEKIATEITRRYVL